LGNFRGEYETGGFFERLADLEIFSLHVKETWVTPHSLTGKDEVLRSLHEDFPPESTDALYTMIKPLRGTENWGILEYKNRLILFSDLRHFNGLGLVAISEENEVKSELSLNPLVLMAA